ncbi:NYN domain-containing protein [Blautia sp. 1033sp1_1033st1_G9_1033SCRN_220408]|uniref:NYN domain-containing protein n=1 Tax=Blautia sp. 1033sp1_1033st1_G9_1033SCRN_220408 TaxID=3144490 RepID=UPI0034A1D752
MYQVNVYTIVSKVAYLIGAEERLFKDGDNLRYEVFSEMNNVSEAKIFRALNIIRTGVMKNFKEINTKIFYEMKNLDSFPEYIDQNALSFLSEHGIKVLKANTRADEYVFIISKLINERAAEMVKICFPVWIKPEYLKSIFTVKCGNKKEGKALAQNFSSKLNNYPYQMFLNFEASEGNILFNDGKFLDLLYRKNRDKFTDSSKVNDISSVAKDDFQEFLEAADDIYIVVDCENADVFKVYSMLEGLKKAYSQDLFKKIKKIKLYDDIHTSSAWKLLQRFTDIKIDHTLTGRVKEDKSLVDTRLTAGVCDSYHVDHIHDFILVSSDSDFFGLIEARPECNFHLMVERKNVSNYVIDAMDEYDAGFCYIDDFCTGNLENLYMDAMRLEIREFLEKKTYIDLQRLFSTAAHNARLDISPSEVESYCNKYSKDIHIERTGNEMRLTI